MDCVQLRKKLLEEGCSPLNFSIGGGGSDLYCIENRNGLWEVYYTERGQDSKPIFSCYSEDDACDYFFNLMMSIEHWHIIGFFVEESRAITMQKQLESSGAKVIRNDIPAYTKVGDPRYRVYVTGKDIFKAQNTFPKSRFPLADR